MTMIDQRPAEVEDRVQAGHWEGDLIMGPGNRSAIGTLWNAPPGSWCCCTCPKGFRPPPRSATRSARRSESCLTGWRSLRRTPTANDSATPPSSPAESGRKLQPGRQPDQSANRCIPSSQSALRGFGIGRPDRQRRTTSATVRRWIAERTPATRSAGRTGRQSYPSVHAFPARADVLAPVRLTSRVGSVLGVSRSLRSQTEPRPIHGSHGRPQSPSDERAARQYGDPTR